jgi:hypothetical protein
MQGSASPAFKKFAFACALILLAPLAHAGPKKAVKLVWRYTTHHKELLISDAAMFLAANADAASTVHCLRSSPFCKESNEILGAHPSNVGAYSLANLYALGLVTMNHFGYRDLEGSKLRHFVWVPSAIWTIGETHAAVHNALYSQTLKGN